MVIKIAIGENALERSKYCGFAARVFLVSGYPQYFQYLLRSSAFSPIAILITKNELFYITHVYMTQVYFILLEDIFLVGHPVA